jgi:hypothetical protein
VSDASRKLWRVTSKSPRETLAILWYVITVFMVLSAVRSNNPVSVVLCLIPTPITLLFGVAELWRALTEEAS